MRLAEKSYSSVIAKQSFGRIVDEAQHTPITITKHNRDIAVIISAEKIHKLSRSLLSNFFQEQVEQGKMTFFEALDRQNEVEAKAAYAIEQHQRNETKLADDAFFDGIREQAIARGL